MTTPTRREFLKQALMGAGAISLLGPSALLGQSIPKAHKNSNLNTIIYESNGYGENIPLPTYDRVEHTTPKWNEVQPGLFFTQVDVTERGQLVDVVTVIKADPEAYTLNMFNTWDSDLRDSTYTVEEWQKMTNAPVIFNSAQYMGDPYGRPVGIFKEKGVNKGPFYNRVVRGVLLGNPKDSSSPGIDLADIAFEDPHNGNTPSEYATSGRSRAGYSATVENIISPYDDAVAHWPIVLNRNGETRVKATDWQASRTMVGKDYDGNFLGFFSQGGFFTVHNFGKFLKDSSFNVHTAMNLDGGYEADVVINTPKKNFVQYGRFETYGPNHNASWGPGSKIAIPGAIGIVPRN